MDTQESPRKRKRDAAATSIPVDPDAKPIVRDEVYYREDGDCVILVDRVLFKIHRFLLERDASAFSNMFSMPQGDRSTDTNTEENPLILYDGVDDFRALCWIIYALPEVCLQQNEIATADMQKLVSLYLIAHKYHFESHETFARNLLYKHIASFIDNAQPWPFIRHIRPNYFDTCPQSQLQSLLHIVSQEKEAFTKNSFSELLQIIWLRRLRKSRETTSFAFEVAEERGLRTFLLNLYLDQVKRMDSGAERINGSTAYIPKVDDLAPHRKLALYQGCWSLRHYWSETKLTVFEREFACSNSLTKHACQTIWKKAWTTKTAVELKLPFFTPFHNLLRVEEEIQISARESRAHAPCAIQAIADMVGELKNTLADHFISPRPSDND